MTKEKVKNKKDLIYHLANSEGMTLSESERIIDAIFAKIIYEVSEKNEFRIAGFGKFIPKYKEPRIARNPQTGEVVEVKGQWKPRFKPAKNFIDKMK